MASVSDPSAFRHPPDSSFLSLLASEPPSPAVSFYNDRPGTPLTSMPVSQYLESLRQLQNLSIPSRTHTSGTATVLLLKDKARWPPITEVHASNLRARAFRMRDGPTGSYEPATLAQTVPYLLPQLPSSVASFIDLCNAASEADGVRNAEVTTYAQLLTIANFLLRDDLGLKIHSHEGLASGAQAQAQAQAHPPVAKSKSTKQSTSDLAGKQPQLQTPPAPSKQKTKEATKDGLPANSVFVDKGIVLKRVKPCLLPDVVEDSRSTWLRADNLKLDTLEPTLLNLLKSILLMVEFKAKSSNETHPDSRVIEWMFETNTEFPGQKDYLLPKGHKAPKMFAQALVYSLSHSVNDMIIDDWTAPKVISFDYERGKANDAAQNKLGQLPQSATFSHLSIAGRHRVGDVTVQQAALFMLADNMAATQGLRRGIRKHFDVNKAAKYVKDPVYGTANPPTFESRAGSARLLTRKVAMARMAAARAAEPHSHSRPGQPQEPAAGARRTIRTPYAATLSTPYTVR